MSVKELKKLLKETKSRGKKQRINFKISALLGETPKKE